MLTEGEKELIVNWKKNYSVYSPWSDPLLFHRIIDEMTEPFMSTEIDKVLGIESKGFVLGAPLAYKLNTGFVVARKGGRLFGENQNLDKVLSEECVDYSGNRKTLELEDHPKGIQTGDKILIVDDWFEAGGQGQTVVRLVERLNGRVIGISILFDQMTDQTRKKFDSYNLHSLIRLQPRRRYLSL